MASVLAGGVVVILGYASGIGITPTDAATAAPPAAAQPPAAAAPAVPATIPPPAAPIAQPAMPGTSTMPDMAMPADAPHQATIDPEPTPSPSEPEPTDPDDTCAPSVLEGLPAVGQLTSSLLSSVVASTPVVSDLAGPPTDGQATGPLSCLIGSLVGPTCCTTTTATAEDAE